MKGIIKRSFAINLMIMRICGWYPPEKNRRFYKVRSYLLHFIFIILVSLLIILHLVLDDNIDIMQESYNAGYLAQMCGFIIKLVPFIKNGEQIKTCINYFEGPYFTVHKNEQKKIIDNCVRITRKISSFYASGVLAATIIWNIKPLFLKGRQFPLNVWLPFNATDDVKIYCFVYAFLGTGFFYAASSTIIDPLIGGLACHAAGQLQVLKDNLQHLNEYAEEKIWGRFGKIPSKEIVTEFLYWEIKQCIQHHNAILDFVKQYEKCFSLAVFCQFASSAVIICFFCLQLSMLQQSGFNIVVFTISIGVTLFQIFFYCYYGTIIFDENNSLTTAIYMGRWYEYDVKSRKALIILMERSKRPMVVTAGKILDLSMTTFTMVLRRSYSLLAVLKNR